MESGQGVMEKLMYRQAIEQEKEIMERGIIEGKRRSMKGKEGMRGMERNRSTRNIEEIWKRRRKLMEGWIGRAEEEREGG